MRSLKGVGINPSSQIHYTDHLAVICVLMGIPLLFIDDLDYSLGSQYYPGLEALQIPYEELNPEFLIANYDVLFLSDLWDKQTFHQKFGPLELKYQKALRHVHVPHGFSDKGFYLRKTAQEDIPLLYGQNMIDMLKYYDVFKHLKTYVISGNYRYTYFKMHRDFFDKVMQEEILCKFLKPQPIILYAPTWKDLEESTTFYDMCSSLIDQLPSDYNMIVKLHPRLELDDTASYYHIVGKYETKPNVLFLKDFPLVYPLLAYSSIYIGDMSSVGYDFLPFNRPMFFLNKHKRDPQTDRGLALFKCGIEVLPEQVSGIYKLIEKSLPQDQERFGTIRREMDAYTFGPERPFEALKADIIKAYST